MAHLQANYPNISKGICREISCRYTVIKHGEIGLTDFRTSWSSARHILGISEKRRAWEKERSTFVMQCCNFSSPSSTSLTSEEELELAGKIEQLGGKHGGGGGGRGGDGNDQFGYLVREYGWKVRRLVEDQSEMRKVAQVQAEAFHVPVILFNDLFFQFFQAEVFSGLVYRLRNSPPDRYACLVAESDTDEPESRQEELVGVVDVTVLRDEAVLQHLPGVEEYLYVSGIAVLNNFRRKKVATALLKACDMLSVHSAFEYLVLRAYEDDFGALKLYRNAGYRIVSGDPPWMTSWIGRKRRVLMIKCPN